MVSEDTTLKVSMVLMAVATADATYLTYAHYRVKEAVAGGLCIELPGVSCDSVLASEYSEIYGVPLAVMGLAGFVAILAVSLTRFLYADKSWAERFWMMLCGLSVGGLAIGGYCTYLEFFVLHEICPWCFLAFVLMVITAAFIFTAYWHDIKRFLGRDTDDEEDRHDEEE